MANLFTYGSLMFPAVWRQLVSEPRESKLAFLPNFSRRLIFLDTYPLIIADTAYTGILGKIYFGLTTADIARLDWFEGEIYRRIRIDAQVGREKISCETYVPKPEYETLVRQDIWRGDIFQSIQMPIFLGRYCNKNVPPKNENVEKNT